MKSESIFAVAAAFITLIGLGRNTDRQTLLNTANGRLRQTIRVSNQCGSCAAAVCSVIHCVCLAANFECCCKLVVGSDEDEDEEDDEK